MQHSIPVTIVSAEAVFEGNKLMVEMTDGALFVFSFNVDPSQCKDAYLKSFSRVCSYRYLTYDQIAIEVNRFNQAQRELANDVYIRQRGYH